MSEGTKIKLGDVFTRQITGEWGEECDDPHDGVKVLRTTNFTNDGFVDFSNVVFRKIPERKVIEKRLLPGDIILEKSGGSDNQPVGRVVFFEDETEVYLCNNFTQVIRPDRSIVVPKYILYHMWYMHRNGVTEAFQNKTTGIRNLQVKRYMDLDIRIPNLKKQESIVVALDAVSEVLRLRKAQLAELGNLVKSQFIEMFGDIATNPKDWPRGTIRDISAEVKYGTSKPAGEGGQYPYLRMNNITYDGQLDISDMKYIDVPDNEIEKYIVRKGDVLFNRTNSKELVGKTCVFDLDTPMIIAGYIIRIRLNHRAIPVYLSAVLNSDYGKLTLRTMCKSIIGQANINAQELQDIEILIPPLDLQNCFADFVHQTDKSKLAIQQALDETQRLFDSLMAEYFEA